MEGKNTMVRVPTETFYEYSLNRYGASDDLDMVLERSRLAGVKSMIITGGSLHESKEALQLAETHGSLLTRKPA
jgi:Tat protein secretion system quality control protein TatD with DNase activity